MSQRSTRKGVWAWGVGSKVESRKDEARPTPLALGGSDERDKI